MRHYLVLLLTVAFMQGAQIAVVGSGYVGLVLGTGLAELGHNVCCLDINEQRIKNLNVGKIPIYELGLEELVLKNLANKNLKFSTDVALGIQESDIVFVAVGTPMKPDGRADLSAVEAVAKTFARNLNGHKTLIIKSTVPVGTTLNIKRLIDKAKLQDSEYSIAFNPEFLREGTAVYDFFNSDRIVGGCIDEFGQELFKEIYGDLIEKGTPIMFTDPTSAELIKYASNAFLATKISYINDLSMLCDATGANVDDVAAGMGMDKRIGSAFLKPGPGFGGSCFPKDVNEIIKYSSDLNVDMQVIKAALQANENKQEYIAQKALSMLNDPSKSTVAALGLAFKANTDDVRDSPAINIINRLVKSGVKIKAYDPIAMENMKEVLPDIEYVSSSEDALSGADLALILTEWSEFKKLDWYKLQELHKFNVLDTRGILPNNYA